MSTAGDVLQRQQALLDELEEAHRLTAAPQRTPDRVQPGDSRGQSVRTWCNDDLSVLTITEDRHLSTNVLVLRDGGEVRTIRNGSSYRHMLKVDATSRRSISHTCNELVDVVQYRASAGDGFFFEEVRTSPDASMVHTVRPDSAFPRHKTTTVINPLGDTMRTVTEKGHRTITVMEHAHEDSPISFVMPKELP